MSVLKFPDRYLATRRGGMSAEYHKLKSGDWGLRITGGAPEEGDVVTVTTKSGEQRQERVGKIVWRSTCGFSPLQILCEVQDASDAC